MADCKQLQIIYRRWLVRYLHAFSCRIDWFVCYFFFILDETEGKVISINLEEIYINRFQEIEGFILKEVETFDISNCSSFLLLIFALRNVKYKVSIPMHSGPNQGFLSNGSIGCVYLVKILAHCAMLQCMSRYNKPP